MTDSVLICPKCRTVIDPSERCESTVGSLRCMELQGHDGYHWTDPGSGKGDVLRWTGLYRTRSCPGRLHLGHWCQKPAGHEGGHNDGRGLTWSEVDSEGRVQVTP